MQHSLIDFNQVLTLIKDVYPEIYIKLQSQTDTRVLGIINSFVSNKLHLDINNSVKIKDFFDYQFTYNEYLEKI